MFNLFKRKPKSQALTFAQLDSLRADLNLTQTKIDNLRAIMPHNAEIQSDLDEAQTELDNSRAKLAIAYRQLSHAEELMSYYQ